VAIALLAIAASALSLLSGSASTSSVARDRGEFQGGSGAVLRHNETFSSPAREGPASYADQLAALDAFPQATISPSEIADARDAHKRNEEHGQGHGKRKAGEWVSLGPTRSVYPPSLNRHGSEYVTSGRITALAISPSCDRRRCTIWVGAAGGGVWRTDKGLSGDPDWKNVSDGFFTSGAVGALTYDAVHDTLYAGTGEDAAAGDAEAGVGVYKSTNGGDTWTPLGGNANFVNRAVRNITVDQFDPTGNTIWIADGRGVHGISSTTAGAVSAIPNSPGVGIWKSTDGGASFTLAQPTVVTVGGTTFPSSFGSSRGATVVAVDPTHAGVVYAGVYNVGVWRSTDNGATWANIHPCSVDPIVPPTILPPATVLPDTGTCGAAADRSEFALVTLPNGDTRMYQTEGDSGPPTDANGIFHGDLRYSRFFIANGVQAGAPTFTDKTNQGLITHTDADGNVTVDPGSPGYATYDFCTGQCWYDQGVYSPPGQPNTLYVFGSFVYPEAPDLSDFSSHTEGNVSNARAVLLSRDGGETFTDLTEDATSTKAPNGIHPDQHALVTNPSNPLQFFEGSDGGLVVSDGTLTDISARCDVRNITGTALARCKQLLSAAPGRLTSLNRGLQTLQFQSLSVSPFDSHDIQGGTQDNGTFETRGSDQTWPQTAGGDGGLSGFDATDRHFRFHTYFSQQGDVSFRDGDPASWDFFTEPIFAEAALFYFPIVTDPVVHATIFAGATHVWRTTDSGGPQAYLDEHCNEFTGDSNTVNPFSTVHFTCGDFVRVGDPTASGRLTCSPLVAGQTNCTYGASRSGGNVGWITRTAADGQTMWASTTTGRLFISRNANAGDPATVAFTRLDAVAPTYAALVPNAPGRAISNIAIDPANPNHAWISYLGYNSSTPATPGHVFSVTVDPVTNAATFTLLDGTGAGFIGDQPVNAVVADPKTGDLYTSTDFGVMRMAADDAASGWVVAAPGLPVVTVAGLTMNADERQLLAATHGRGAYQLTLPRVDNDKKDKDKHGGH